MKLIIKQIKPYPLIFQKILKFKNFKKTAKLDWNEFPYSPKKEVVRKIINFLKKNNSLNWYPSIYPEKLLKKIAKYVGTNVSKITAFSGSDSCLELISKIFINKNDKVLIVSPTYDQFRIECLLSEAKIISFIPKNIFKANILELNSIIKKKKIKLVYLANPNNPTGLYYDLKKINFLIKNNKKTTFIIDEAYIEFTDFKSCSILLKQNINNLFVTRTFSKCFGLAGLRLGYCISSNKNIIIINKIKNHKSINSLAQIAGEQTLNHINFYKKKIVTINNLKKELIKKLQKINIEVISTPCNFILIKDKNINKIYNFLEKNKIYVRKLNHLPILKEYLRISIGNKNEINYLINKLNDYKSI